MNKLVKVAISTVTAAIISTSLCLSVSALSKEYTITNGDVMRASLDVSSTTAEAVTRVGDVQYEVVANIHASYYLKGTTTKRNTNEFKRAYIGFVRASVSNSGGTWISVQSSHTAEKDIYSGSITLNW